MKITNILLSLLIICHAFFFQSCSSEDDQPIENLELSQRKATEFGINLFKCAEQASPNKNLILSPFDAQLALSMSANLLDATYRNQVCHIFGYENISELNAANKFLIKQLTSPITIFQDEPPILTTKISNSVWSNVDIARKDKRSIAKHYFADVKKCNLNSEEGVTDINNWMKESGIRMSKPLIPDKTNFAIYTTLYFNQEWNYEYHFSKSYRDIFHTLQGEKPIAFMKAAINARYLCNEKHESVILELSKFQMICILPVNTNLSETIKDFEATDLYNIIDNARIQDIKLYFPVFKLDKQLSLNSLLKKCKIDISNQNVTCEQASFIKVDQKGVAAGSITSLYCILSAPNVEDPIELKFNRPFMFFIVDPETKTLLFAGQCVGPVE